MDRPNIFIISVVNIVNDLNVSLLFVPNISVFN